MDPRATQTLAWLDANVAQVAAHPGAAFAEVEILRAMVTHPHSGTSAGRMQSAHLAKLNQHLRTPTNRAEVYGLTHDVLFATDFGRVRKRRPVVGALIDTLIAPYLEDLDLLGELLMAALCIEHTSFRTVAGRKVFDRGWRALNRANFAENYHPLLVGALLYAMD